MNRGVPPTARNARTGEFTPPGTTARARSNSAREAGASASRWAGRARSVSVTATPVSQRAATASRPPPSEPSPVAIVKLGGRRGASGADRLGQAPAIRGGGGAGRGDRPVLSAPAVRDGHRAAERVSGPGGPGPGRRHVL